jgi:hypothetical protein
MAEFVKEAVANGPVEEAVANGPVEEEVANGPVKEKVATGPPDFLAKKHPHKRDRRIKFYEIGHRYTVDELEGYTSVTTWIHHHFPPFNADSVIDKMEKGKNWRDGEKNKKYWDQETGKPMTREKIKGMWDAKRDAAAQAGTAMHYDIECYYNGIETYNTSTEYQYFKEYLKDFKRDNPDLIPYRTEWTVFDEEMKLAGSIDMVYQDTLDETGDTLAIYDWKRCAEISHENKFSSALTPEIKHLPDTNFWHYSLQLNTYKTILERKYDKKVTNLVLVVLHPDNMKYQLHDVEIMEKEMNDLFKARRTELSKKKIDEP